MPELPDLVVYLEALDTRIVGTALQHVRIVSPFVLRSVNPPIETVHGLIVRGLRRQGKRLVLVFDDEVFLVIHLMIAGRLRWRAPGRKDGVGPRMVLARFEFERGTLLFTEAGSTKRASLTLVQGETALAALDRGGIDPFGSTLDQFREVLARESHTLKRTLTDPRLVSGIGNAYSYEILHAARLSPLKLTRTLTDEESSRLFAVTRATLAAWTARLREASGGEFPDIVTAFHDEMAVHGRYNKPCPECGSPVQRIVYATNECTYCATCQTGGRRLADRALSRLLREDWPRTLDPADN